MGTTNVGPRLPYEASALALDAFPDKEGRHLLEGCILQWCDRSERATPVLKVTVLSLNSILSIKGILKWYNPSLGDFKMPYFVYQTTNVKTGEYYIGTHKTRFANDDYLGSGLRISRAVEIHGKENFKKTILFSFTDRTAALNKEKEIIKSHSKDPLCYNLQYRPSRPIKYTQLPNPVKQAIKSLGHDLRIARIVRRIPARILAERASVARATIVKIEQGSLGTSIGNIAAVAHSLGLIGKLEKVFDAVNDEVGMSLRTEALPKRIRLSSG
jgi:hypothetical protein